MKENQREKASRWVAEMKEKKRPCVSFSSLVREVEEYGCRDEGR